MMGPQDAVKMRAKLKKFDELQVELDDAYYHLKEASKLQNYNMFFVMVPAGVRDYDVNIRVRSEEDSVLHQTLIKTLMNHWNDEVNRIKARMKEL